jgi:predicted XRE-type DNA-binding protein
MIEAHRAGMKVERFDSVWDAIEDSPTEAENMKVRSALLTALRDHITEAGLTQKEAAKQLGVTQPRISDLMRGRVDLFAVERLLKMLAMAGLRVEVKVGKAA